MADALKEMFNHAFYLKLSNALSDVYPAFKKEAFVKEVNQKNAVLSLNERMHNCSIILKNYLPENYQKAIHVLYDTVPTLDAGYTTLIFPDFVGRFGLNNFTLSMEALAVFTTYGSSEFAVREFLKRDFDKTIAVMKRWTNHENHHVRRLASEGSRPRLPWSFKIDEIIRNPNSTLLILEALREDEELYVRKSVANHLNDISKDNPQWMVEQLQTWNSRHVHTEWIKKHACRTLIKKGDQRTLALFGFEKEPQLTVSDLKINSETLQLGETLLFNFKITSLTNKPQKLVVDFIVHYVKKNGAHAPKTFKLKEFTLGGMLSKHVSKQQLFKDFSTRKHYAGMHKIEILVNGTVMAQTSFELL